MKKQPIWKIILVISNSCITYQYSSRIIQIKKLKKMHKVAVDRMMEMKKQAAQKDTISLIPLVTAKKIDSL